MHADLHRGSVARVVALAIVVRKRWPVASFGIGWYLIAHAVESSVFALELVYEHRNYLPSLGPILIGVWGLVHISSRTKWGYGLLGVVVVATMSVPID